MVEKRIVRLIDLTNYIFCRNQGYMSRYCYIEEAWGSTGQKFEENFEEIKCEKSPYVEDTGDAVIGYNVDEYARSEESDGCGDDGDLSNLVMLIAIGIFIMIIIDAISKRV